MGLGAAGKRLLLEIVGWVLVVLGIAALVLPGPGLLALFAGLALLSQQYAWARRAVEPVRERALQTAADGVRTWPRILLSVGLALCLMAAGVLWAIRPEPPSWWTLRDGWWLMGGWGAGVTMVFSSLAALALIGYSYRHHRRPGANGSPEPADPAQTAAQNPPTRR